VRVAAGSARDVQEEAAATKTSGKVPINRVSRLFAAAMVSRDLHNCIGRSGRANARNARRFSARRICSVPDTPCDTSVAFLRQEIPGLSKQAAIWPGNGDSPKGLRRATSLSLFGDGKYPVCPIVRIRRNR
jgi:hypothetical protein